MNKAPFNYNYKADILILSLSSMFWTGIEGRRSIDALQPQISCLINQLVLK